MGRKFGHQAPTRLMRQKVLTFVLLSLLVLGLSCSSRGCSSAPPDWNKVIKNDQVPGCKQEESANAPKATEDLIVYLDTSSSMAGYISQDKQKATVFSRTLQELRNFSTIISPPLNVYVRRVDANVGEPLNDTFLSEASINQATYNGKETNLSGAIETFGRGVHKSEAKREKIAAAKDDHEDDTEAEKEEEEPPPARFHILVTDGVQSTRQSNDASCVAGSDQICVRKKILTLLNKDWGAYVIGLRSEFKGKIYSEVNRTAIPYESKVRDPQSYRPFYLYLFSPDRVALDKFASALRERLRPLVGQDDAFRVLALISAYAGGCGKGELQIPKETANPLESRSKEENPSRFTLKVSLDTEKTDAKPFTILATVDWSNNVKNSGTPKEMASLIKWNLVPIYPDANRSSTAKGVRLPEVNLVGTEPQSDGNVNMEMTAQWPRASGTPQWRVYRLEGRLNLEKQTPLWIKQWSTEMDTTVEMGNRTLYLESALLGLWNNPKLKDQLVSEMYLRIGPK